MKLAVGTRQAKTNKTNNVPTINELNQIKTFIFRLDGDSPELIEAVENSLQQLRIEFPNYMFKARYGNS